MPYAYLFVFRYGANLWDQRKSLARPEAVSIGLSMLLFTHLVPFALATWRHLDWSNVRQEALMNVAENLTDPEKDPVYDAIGMVSARPIVNAQGGFCTVLISRVPEIPDRNGQIFWQQILLL